MQALWALKGIASDFIEHRLLILNNGAFLPLMAILTDEDLNLREAASELLEDLFDVPPPPPLPLSMVVSYIIIYSGLFALFICNDQAIYEILRIFLFGTYSTFKKFGIQTFGI